MIVLIPLAILTEGGSVDDAEVLGGDQVCIPLFIPTTEIGGTGLHPLSKVANLYATRPSGSISGQVAGG